MNAPSRITPKQARSIETIETIMEAVRLQLRSGETLSMQSIADKAGVSIGTVYHHFKSKDQILGYAYGRYLDRIADEIEQRLEAGTPVPDILRDVFSQNIIDAEYYRNIRDFLSNSEATTSPIWEGFTDRLADIFFRNSPDYYAGMDRECAQKIMKLKFDSVRAMWQGHVATMDTVSRAYHAAFVNTLAGLMAEQ
jgi:AcrR family transcriptional regulator